MWPTARAHTYTHTQGTDGKQKRTHTAKAMPYSLVVQLRQSGSHFAIEPVTSRRGNDRKARPATATTIISSYNNDNKKKQQQQQAQDIQATIGKRAGKHFYNDNLVLGAQLHFWFCPLADLLPSQQSCDCVSVCVCASVGHHANTPTPSNEHRPGATPPPPTIVH